MIRLTYILSCMLYLHGMIQAQPVPTAEFPFKMTVEQYVQKYAALAVSEMYRSRIPASITLAQGLIESGNGNSRLAMVANNHFGIKCKKDWTGESIREDDDEAQECFRKYKSPEESYRDHSDFLMKGQRYAFLFDLEPTDYKAWAHGLKKAGYATNPRYAEILIQTIEKNNLQRFDVYKPTQQEVKEVAEEKSTQRTKEMGMIINGVPAIVVASGESFASIALANGMRVWQLYKYNDLEKNAVLSTGDTLYIKPKNYKSETPTYVVVSGDNMHRISQRYAIKLSRLLALNRMKEGQEPQIGETLQLRSKRPTPPRIREVATPMQLDTTYDNKIYDNPQKNIETSQPIIPQNPYDVQARGVKEPMAFIHKVQPGETLFALSKRYNVQVEAIRELNRLPSDRIQPGDMLVINPNQPAATKQEEAVVPGYHTVMQGETLYSIAKLYGSTVDMLKSLNELENDTIRVGDELIIIARHGEKPGEQKITDDEGAPVYYIVREGETIYAISRKFGTDQATLRKWNGLLDNTIQVGQKLRVR